MLRLLALLVVGLVMVQIGCADSGMPWSKGTQVKPRNLEPGADIVARYGMASISAPVLVPNQAGVKSPFAFDLSKTSAEYFELARSESGFALSSQDISEFVARFAAKASSNPTIADAFETSTDQFQRADLLRQEASRVRVALARDLLQREAQRIMGDSSLTPEQRQAQLDQATTNYAASLEKAVPADAPTAPPTAKDQALPTIDISLPDVSKSLVSAAQKPNVDASALKAPSRAAQIAAAGDVTTQGILRVLGHPAAYTNMNGKVVLFGVSMVSVEPGYLTREGFAADVAMKVEYTWLPARPEAIQQALNDDGTEASYIVAMRNSPSRPVQVDVKPEKAAQVLKDLRQLGVEKLNKSGITNIDATKLQAASGLANVTGTDFSKLPSDLYYWTIQRAPLVSAVSPMTDVQSLDLTSSIQRRREFALDLAFALELAGLGGQAKSFFSYAKQLDDVSASRTLMATATTYSNSGGLVGFQVGPRFAATLLPGRGSGTKNNAGISNTLERQSFPVLFVILMDQSDLRLRFDKEGNLYEPHIQMSQTARWLPLDAKSSRKMLKEKKWLAALNDALPSRTEPNDNAGLSRGTSDQPEQSRKSAAGKTKGSAGSAESTNTFNRADDDLAMQAMFGPKGNSDLPGSNANDVRRRTYSANPSPDPDAMLGVRAEILAWQFGASYSSQEIPLEVMPGYPTRPAAAVITSVTPAQIAVTLNKTTTPAALSPESAILYVEGQGLTPYTEATIVSASGQALGSSIAVEVLGDKAIKIPIALPSESAVWTVRLQVPGDPSSARLAPSVVITVTKKEPEKPKSEADQISAKLAPAMSVTTDTTDTKTTAR